MLGNFSNNINFLHKALDGSWARLEANSNNIANVNTPGYKRLTVEFETMLKDELNNKKLSLTTTNSKHLTGVKSNEFIIKRDTDTKTSRDGNNVNIDVETADLAKNTIMYNALLQQISGRFDRMKTVISEGGK